MWDDDNIDYDDHPICTQFIERSLDGGKQGGGVKVVMMMMKMVMMTTMTMMMTI